MDDELYYMNEAAGRILEALGERPAVRHPGLRMDVYALYGADRNGDWVFDQGLQSQLIDAVIETNRQMPLREGAEAARALAEGEAFAAALPGPKRVWTQTTRTPLALHLSRPGTLENGSVCLHPVYGFAYLPSPKGVLRAYLQEHRDDGPAAERLFGSSQAAGRVEVLEAWPTAWPLLVKEIVNNHHRRYYAERGRGGAAPGPWEGPNLTSFLAVAPGTTFRFCLTAQGRGSRADVDAAAALLQDALREIGAGAKTAVGYGFFGAPQE